LPIPAFPEAFYDYLVSDVETCAIKVLGLLGSAEERKAFGTAGQENVRKKFLLPRLMRDELRLVKEVLSL
jgi:trehalose synthase